PAVGPPSARNRFRASAGANACSCRGRLALRAGVVLDESASWDVSAVRRSMGLSPPNQGDADVAAQGCAARWGSAPRTRGTLMWRRRGAPHDGAQPPEPVGGSARARGQSERHEHLGQGVVLLGQLDELGVGELLLKLLRI